MKNILILLLFFSTTTINAQESWSWKIYHNKKLVLSTKEENEAKNVIKVNATDLKKAGELSVTFTETPPNKDWKRTFAIFNEKDSVVFEKSSPTTVKIPNATIKKISTGQKRIKLYTWSLPRNPQLASTIRIRRVHLCTIEFE